MQLLIYLGLSNIIVAIVVLAWFETRPAARREREAIKGIGHGQSALLSSIVSYSNTSDEVTSC